MPDLSVSDRASAVRPYLRPVLEDREVRDAVMRLAGAGRETYRRARGKSPTEAVNDKRLRRRAGRAVLASWQLLEAIEAAQTRPRRPRRPRRVALVLIAAASAYGAYLVSNADGRNALRGLIPDHHASSRSSSG